MREKCIHNVIEISISLVLKIMLYVVIVACVFKFMYCVAIVFMMQQLKSMSVLIHLNSDQLDITEKVVEKVIMDGASTKGNCFAPQYNIGTLLPQQDNMQRLSRMIEEMPEFFDLTLNMNHNKLIYFIRVVFLSFLKGCEHNRITILVLVSIIFKLISIYIHCSHTLT